MENRPIYPVRIAIPHTQTILMLILMAIPSIYPIPVPPQILSWTRLPMIPFGMKISTITSRA